MSRLVKGVGINDADYVAEVYEEVGCVGGKRKRKLIWQCPFYRTWKDMLSRGYDDEFKIRCPTYKHVTVCPEWHLFSTFRSWMVMQDWEGKQLDKDLLVTGNKVYSPENCVFVSRQVNNFMVDCGAARGLYLIGASWRKDRGKFQAHCSNPFTGKKDYLGYFTNEEQAHQAWLAKKLEHTYALAAIQTDDRVAEALINRYESYY